MPAFGSPRQEDINQGQFGLYNKTLVSETSTQQQQDI